MPFVVKLGKDKLKNGLAPCSQVATLWEDQPWEVRREYCKVCPFRFIFEMSCSMDFLTVGDSDAFKEELASALNAIATTTDDRWSSVKSAMYEAELAYHMMGKKAPGPKKVVGDFVSRCTKIKKTDEFWKLWNYVGVEGFDGKVALAYNAEGPAKDAINRIFEALTEIGTYGDSDLYLLYATSAVLCEMAINMNLIILHTSCTLILEACRTAIHAKTSVEVT